MSMNEIEPRRPGVWLRVSTDHQASKNQVPDVERFLAHRDWEEARRYILSESAWNVKGGGVLSRQWDGTSNGNGGEYVRLLRQALEDAHIGHINVLVIWALDRITREGMEAALKIKRMFAERGCELISLKEPWINGTSGIEEPMLAFKAWSDQQESTRRSDRIRAGLAERRRKIEAGEIEGRIGGRQEGAKDKRPRAKKTGIAAGWTDARKEALRARNQQRAPSATHPDE